MDSGAATSPSGYFARFAVVIGTLALTWSLLVLIGAPAATGQTTGDPPDTPSYDGNYGGTYIVRWQSEPPGEPNQIEGPVEFSVSGDSFTMTEPVRVSGFVSLDGTVPDGNGNFLPPGTVRYTDESCEGRTCTSIYRTIFHGFLCEFDFYGLITDSSEAAGTIAVECPNVYGGFYRAAGHWNASLDDDAPVISNVTASPKTLVANGRRSTRIKFSISENGSVRMVIRNSLGSRVFKTSGAVTKGPGVYYFDWNGTNDRNRLVPAGVYKVSLTPTDKAGNIGRTASVRVTVER